MSSDDKRFYVYAWLRPDGTPFYIGKGCGKRAWTQSCHRQRVPDNRSIRILSSGLSNEEAVEWEVALIALLGRKDLGTGCLRNLTNGGEGIPGFRFSEESRRKMAGPRKPYGPQSESHKSKRAAVQRKTTTWHHPEYGVRVCSASELMEEYKGLSRAGLSRLFNGVYPHYKGWSLTR